jgi:hypothetical protein
MAVVSHFANQGSAEEFAKLCGARALFGHFVTLSVTKIIKFLGKIDDHLK